MAAEKSQIGLYGLAVMGQNLALNIADKGFSISVCNRSYAKTETTVKRSVDEKVKGKLRGFKEMKDFVASIQKPRAIIILVKAGKPVTAVINGLVPLLEDGDLIIDGGNEWYINTEMRAKVVSGVVDEKNDEPNTSGIINKENKKLEYMGMGVSGGEEGARYGPSLMPGGPIDAYNRVSKILEAIAARAEDGTVCVTYIGKGGAGNYVKMVHNGIEYGDMQLIAEAYDLMKRIGGLSNDQLAQVFSDWNKGELNSFLIEITAQIFKKKDDRGNDKNAYLVDRVLDKTGQKGTGKWTVKEAAEQGIAAPTISAALNTRYLSSLKDERLDAAKDFAGPNTDGMNDDLKTKEKLDEFIKDVKGALYASKIMSYTQGMNLIRRVGVDNDWNLNLGKIASIWKGGCIIRAQFLDRITAAYDRNPKLRSLLFDSEFAKEVKEREASWRRVVGRAIAQGIAVPAMAGSLTYYDTYRRGRLPANLTQSQRDFFGAHTYQRVDDVCGEDFVHSEWAKL